MTEKLVEPIHRMIGAMNKRSSPIKENVTRNVQTNRLNTIKKEQSNIFLTGSFTILSKSCFY